VNFAITGLINFGQAQTQDLGIIARAKDGLVPAKVRRGAPLLETGTPVRDGAYGSR